MADTSGTTITADNAPQVVKASYDDVNNALEGLLGNLSGNNSRSNDGTPVWVPQPCPFATAPSGYLLANGASFSTTQYPLLGAAFTSGVLPDLRGLFIRGLDTSGNIDNVSGGRTLLSVEEGSRITGEWSSDFNGLSMITNNINTMASRLAGMQALGWDTVSNHSDTFTTYHAAGTEMNATYDTSGEVLGVTCPKNMAWNYVFRAA